MAHWYRILVVAIVLCICAMLLWAPFVISEPPEVAQLPSTLPPALEEPPTSPHDDSQMSASPSEPVTSTSQQPAAAPVVVTDARVVLLSVNDGRLRCGKTSNASCEHWWQRSWFADRRDPIIDGVFTATRIRAGESRPLDSTANTTNNEDVMEQHHNEHWAPHWRLRYPSVKWSRAAATSQRERAVLTADILESRVQLQLKDIENSQTPQRVEDLEFITNVPPLYSYRRASPEARWEALDRAAGTRTTRIACLYAGFARDIEKMYASCRDRKSARACNNRYVNKLSGNMRDNIVKATQCDVYVTTWEIRGAGRYSTTGYDMTDLFPIPSLHSVYGEQLAAAHVQNFTQYQKLWRYMHKFSRVFPQTRPTKSNVNHDTKEYSFEGVPEMNHVIRINDYSQSYKHWVVANLALLSDVSYDVFFRLRMDLRATSRLDTLRPVMMNDDASHGTRAMAFKLESAPYGGARSNNASVLEAPMHFVTANRVHMNNFDIADFGFMGPPFLIEELSRLWYYCLTTPSSPLAPFDFAMSLTPSEKYSEYNLMLWRIVFDNKWAVDSGGRYLWVSRYGTHRRTK